MPIRTQGHLLETLLKHPHALFNAPLSAQLPMQMPFSALYSPHTKPTRSTSDGGVSRNTVKMNVPETTKVTILEECVGCE